MSNIFSHYGDIYPLCIFGLYGDIDPLYIFIMEILIYYLLYVVITTHVTFCISCLFMVLSTQMALLCLSADIPYVGTQKDILGLKFAKTL